MDKNTLVISAFPACGKSYYTNHYSNYTKIILDSDSSNFSWMEKDGEKFRNPLFPQNYINYIKANLGKADIIFVSSHKTVRDVLKENNIDYFIIYPEPTIDNRSVWVKRMRDRGSSDSLITTVYNNWFDWLGEIQCESFPYHYILDCSNNAESNGMWIDEKVIDNIKYCWEKILEENN